MAVLKSWWLAASVGVGLLFAFVAMHRTFSFQFVLSDDVRIHIWWMQRFQNPSLFPKDFMADYFMSSEPLGFPLQLQPDAGSLFLGFFLAVLGIKLRFENIVNVTFFVPMAVMGVAIVDTLLVTFSRIKRRRSPFQGGKDHISHRLVSVGIPAKGAVGLLYFAGAGFGWVGLVIAFAQLNTAYMLTAGLIVLSFFLAWLLMKVPV